MEAARTGSERPAVVALRDVFPVAEIAKAVRASVRIAIVDHRSQVRGRSGRPSRSNCDLRCGLRLGLMTSRKQDHHQERSPRQATGQIRGRKHPSRSAVPRHDERERCEKRGDVRCAAFLVNSSSRHKQWRRYERRGSSKNDEPCETLQGRSPVSDRAGAAKCRAAGRMSRQDCSETRRNAHDSYPIALKPNPGNDETRGNARRRGRFDGPPLAPRQLQAFRARGGSRAAPGPERASKARLPCTQVGKRRTAIQRANKSGDPS